MTLVQEEVGVGPCASVRWVLDDMLGADHVPGCNESAGTTDKEISTLDLSATVGAQVTAAGDLEPGAQDRGTGLAVLGHEEPSNRKSAAGRSGDDAEELAGLNSREQSIEHVLGKKIIAVVTAVLRIVVHEG